MHEYTIMDVFTDRRLEGNPLAVFPAAADLDGAAMQRIAREMNLSETVFVLPAAGDDAHARIRIFTPQQELPFAGHPTLGTAILLAEAAGLTEIRLACAAGTVPVALSRADGRVTGGRMSQPVPTWEPFDLADAVLRALGVAKSALPVDVYTNGPRHTVVVLDDPEQVAALSPDLTALGALPAVGVSAIAGSGTDWKSRMFGPSLGVPEDPATGSAAGPIAVHLARYGRIGFGEEIRITQGVEIGRPSLLLARADGAATADGHRIDRVEVAGSAVVVARGSLLV